jgi:hypothetical protein
MANYIFSGSTEDEIQPKLPSHLMYPGEKDLPSDTICSNDEAAILVADNE